MKKTFIAFLISFVLVSFSAPEARAQANYYNADAVPKAEQSDSSEIEKPKNFTVTSLQKCYAQLPPDDVLDIQRNFIKPYQECQNRLAKKIKAEKMKKVGTDEKATGENAENPHGFYRVQKRKRGDEENAEDAPAKKPKSTDKTDK